MVYYDPRKPKPWPIEFLKKLGVKSDKTATAIIIIVSVLFIIIALYLFNDTNAADVRTLTPEENRMLRN